jgi:hypothetical protein
MGDIPAKFYRFAGEYIVPIGLKFVYDRRGNWRLYRWCLLLKCNDVILYAILVGLKAYEYMGIVFTLFAVIRRRI